MNFPSYGQSEFSHERFQRIHEEVNDEKSSNHLVPSVVPQSPDQNPPPTQSSSTLDQLWERFCSRWHLEDSQPTSNREASLLERLERLSRLIHNTRGSKAPASSRGSEDGAQRMEDGREDEAAGTQQRLGEARKTEAESGPVRWVEHPSEHANGCSHGAARHQHLCPADRDETDAVSTSGSISTVDTARLVRAFGSHRVQLLKTSCSLRKLYSTIDKQRERRSEEQWGGRSEEQLSISAASRLTQDSTVSEFSSAASGGLIPAVAVGFDGKEQKEVRFKRSALTQPGVSRHTRLQKLRGIIDVLVKCSLFMSALVFRCLLSRRSPPAPTASPPAHTRAPPGREAPPERGRQLKWPTKASRRVSVGGCVWIWPHS